MTSQIPGALNPLVHPAPRPGLESLSLVDIATELVARLNVGETFERDKDLLLAAQLQDLLETRLDVHLNRFARRRLYDVVRPVLDRLPPGELKGGTVVDLGSGSLNPFAFGFVLLMMGARRAYSIDLTPVQDLPRAVRALAATAGWLLIDPTRVVGDHALDPSMMLEHLDGFDLSRLSMGDPAGIASDRLVYNIESVYDLSLDDCEADLVSSVSLLEHVDRIDDVLESLRRVTKPGGVGHHIVDFIDHRVYGGEVDSAFDFLRIENGASLVHGCNRIRCGQLCALFERYGFLVEQVDPSRTEPLTDEEQRQFAEPFRSMDRADLTVVCARIVVRRR